MTRRPGPRVLTEEALSDLLGARHFSILATNGRYGHPHLTTMVHGWDPDARVVRFFTTADRVKARHLRRDPRAAVHVQGDDVWSFAVAEGEAEVSEATAVPGDAVGLEVLAMLPEPMRPADERAFLERLVEERRVVIRLRVSRMYGTALDVEG